jgi:hypothetical protein
MKRSRLKRGNSKARKHRMVVILGVSLSPESAKKVQQYLNKFGEFEAYNMFGEDDDTIEQGVRRMVLFYKENPDAPV